jgi:hypothetical protein
MVDPPTINIIEIFFHLHSLPSKENYFTKMKTQPSSLSTVVANIFMEHFEDLAPNCFHIKAKYCFWFVDEMSSILYPIAIIP